MHPLVWLSIDAHGGIDGWRRIRQISASFIPSGTLVQYGLAASAQSVARISVDTREQMAILEPFLAQGQSVCFQIYIASVDSRDGKVLESLISPRSSFAGTAPGTPWSATQLAYVVGYAAWMYLTVPLSLMRAGVRCVETAKCALQRSLAMAGTLTPAPTITILGVVCSSVQFLHQFPSNFSRTRLSAVATIASSAERGFQPNMRFAFALVAFMLTPNMGAMAFI